MYERFSDRARHAMALANLEASKLNDENLAPEHIMLGLIAEGQCVATEALRLFDVDLQKIRDKVSAGIAHNDGNSKIGRRAHTKETKEVISKAIEEARRFGHRYVGTEHLVLGLLGQTDGLPSKVLREQGVQLEHLREKTLGLLQSSSTDPAHDLSHSRHGDFEWVHQQELSKAFRSAKFWHTMIMAVDSANRLGAGEVEPEHLLMALLRDESTKVSKMLRGKGITADTVREQLA